MKLLPPPCFLFAATFKDVRMKRYLLLVLGLVACVGCISSEYVESPKAPTVKTYEDESTVKQYRNTKELGEAHPFLIVDGKELDYDAELEWFVYPGTKTKAYWLEPAEYIPDSIPSRVLVGTDADGNPAIGPLDASYEISRVWSESKQAWEKPDGNGGFRPWDPELDGNAPPPPPPIDDKITKVDDEENVWHVLKPLLVATRPESINSVFMDPTPDERRVQKERVAHGKLIWLYPTTQLKYLETSEFNGVKYYEFAVVAAVLDADADGNPVDLRRAYVPSEMLKQPEMFKLGPPGDVEAAAAPVDPTIAPPPGPVTFQEVELKPGGVIEIGTPSDAAKNPKSEIDGVKVRYDEKRKEYFDAYFEIRLIPFGGTIGDFTDYRCHDEQFKNKDGDIRFLHKAREMEIMEGGEWRPVKTGDTIAARQAAFMVEKPDARLCPIGQSHVRLTTTDAPEGRYRIVLATDK